MHFSKEAGVLDNGNLPYYGFAVDLNEERWKIPDRKSYYSKMSQEHGVVKASDHCFEKYNVGDVIGILPIHSCMTADLFRSYKTSSGPIERL